MSMAETPRAEATGQATSVPDLSIIVLTYDRPRLLRSCLESLCAQTYPAERFEIVVADDGSSDETAAVVSEYAARHSNVRHVRHPHRGIPATRNLGLRHARAALVAIVADDYELPPTYVRRIIDFFRANPEASVLRFSFVPASRNPGSRISHLYYQASIRGRVHQAGDSNAVTTRHRLDASGASAFRRGVFSRVGLFDENLARAEDSDFTVRLRRAGIAVHFDPAHPVRHHYDPYLRDTLRKSWLTGWYRCLHYRKNRQQGVTAGAILDVAAGKLRTIGLAFAEARRETPPLFFLLALPFLVLFEAANKGGFICSWLWHVSHGRRQRASTDDSA